jgi:hypothetical protein
LGLRSDIVDGVTPTASEVATAAEMAARIAATTKMCAAMTTAVMTTAAMAPTSVTATSRSGITSGQQHGRENNNDKPDIEF